MSTTFAVKTSDGEMKNVARRTGKAGGGVNLYWTDSMAEMLADDTIVEAIDNTPQGIFTIGDIKNAMREAEEDEEWENKSWIDDPTKIEIRQRKSAFVPMKDAWHKEHDFIEVTEWSNGEGWDITCSDDKYISLHFTELRVINELVALLEDK